MPTWVHRLPTRGQDRDIDDRAIAKAKGDASRLSNASDNACAEALALAAAEATRVAVIVKPGSASGVWQPYWPVFARAIKHVTLNATNRKPAAIAGILSFATLVMSHGGYVPDFYDRQTRSGLEHELAWLEEIARSSTSSQRGGDAQRLLGFAALAAGRSHLATLLSDDPALATLVAAIAKPAGDVTTAQAFATFIAAFPDAVYRYGELGFAARAFVVHVERRGAGGIGAAAAWLHRMVHEGPPTPIKPTPSTPIKPVPVAHRGAAPPTKSPASPASPTSPASPAERALTARAAVLFAQRVHATTRNAAWSSIALDDVDALHGGRSIRIDATGGVQVTDVSQGAKEARQFQAVLAVSALEQLGVILRANPPRAIMTSKRMGVAGEGRPIIEVETSAGKYSVGKWANDQHPQFDAIADFLGEVATVLAATGSVTKTGRWSAGRFES